MQLQLTFFEIFLKYRQHWTAYRTSLSWLHAACFNKIEQKDSEYRAMDANVFEVWMRRAAEQLEVPSDAGFLAYDIFPQGWRDGSSKLGLQRIEWLFKGRSIEVLNCFVISSYFFLMTFWTWLCNWQCQLKTEPASQKVEAAYMMGELHRWMPSWLFQGFAQATC